MNKFEDEHGEFVPFEYVKSIGQNICPLNLYGNKEPSGENIYSMCKQGPIYIRASKMLKVWPQDDTKSEDSVEDELDSSENSSSYSQPMGTKRTRQSTLVSTDNPSKRVCWHTDKLVVNGSPSHVAGQKTIIVSILKVDKYA